MARINEVENHIATFAVYGAMIVVAAAALLIACEERGQPEAEVDEPKSSLSHSERRVSPEYFSILPPNYAKPHSLKSEAVLVWGGKHEFAEELVQHPSISNIEPDDYVGAEACSECHDEKYDSWSDHSHRWMNARATEESVKGDFSGSADASIRYRGGTADFYKDGGEFRMKLSRGITNRTFKINRTLGSRVHQYYIGVLEDGPEPDDHPFRSVDHVLPFGYELTMKEWIPIVHARGQQGKDEERDDPFVKPSQLPYDTSCSMCHTTQPMGNLMLAMFKRFAAYSPRDVHFEGSNYIDKVSPGSVRLNLAKDERVTEQNLRTVVNDVTTQSQRLMTEEMAINLGIACEACHLGAKAHANNEKISPPFFPASKFVHSGGGADDSSVWGRNSANKNFTCARCHSGERPQYAAGMATWNSTEYTDALRGHCYDPAKADALGMRSLACVACHDPHEAIGRNWDKPHSVDQQACLKCHPQFKSEVALQAHTRHPIDSSGSQCMNCHMPKINEGMGDMVRTHTIFRPTNRKMLEANQPNACNMCHVEEPIDWTLNHLKLWYGEKFEVSQEKIDRSYPNRTQSVALGWLGSEHSGTRLVGADVLLKAKATWALPQLIATLDDPYMEVRQFSVQRLKDYFQIDTNDYGYKTYMTKGERRAPLRKMSKALIF